MIDFRRSALIVAIIAAVTILLRFAPFLIFGEKRKTLEIISYLGKVLPCAIMGMLIIFCLKNVSPLSYPYGIPELISCLLVVALHIWKRNTLISIICGTVCYMVLIQFIF